MPEIELPYTQFREDEEHTRLKTWARQNQTPGHPIEPVSVRSYDGRNRQGMLFHIGGDPLILLEGKPYYDPVNGGSHEARLIFTQSQRPILLGLVQEGILPKAIESKLGAVNA